MSDEILSSVSRRGVTAIFDPAQPAFMMSTLTSVIQLERNSAQVILSSLMIIDFGSILLQIYLSGIYKNILDKNEKSK